MKHTIEIDVPEGYKPVRFGPPLEGETYIGDLQDGIETSFHDFSTHSCRLIVEKIKPRRLILECISEEPRQAMPGEWWKGDYGDMYKNDHDVPTTRKYTIWKEVIE